MNITTEKNNDTLTINVEGRIDSTSAPELESTIKDLIENCTDMVFDFKNLEYISSAGLRILLGARKLLGNNGTKVINVNDTIYEIFEVTGFSLILDVEQL